MPVLKVHGKVKLCLDPARLNNVLIRPVPIGSKLNDVLPRLAGIKYFMFIDVSLGYHNPKLNEKSSYLTIPFCPFDRY